MINASKLNAFFTGLKALFLSGFEMAETQWQKLAMEVKSTSKQTTYGWLKGLPKLREWLGEKEVHELEAFGFTIINKPFEATVAVKRDDLDDDEVGFYSTIAQEAGYEAKLFPENLVIALIAAGFTGLCYDGKAFFATNHKLGKETINNKGTVALSIATQAAAAASFGAARTAMRKYKDAQGRPMGIKPNILLVPPALEDTAKALMTVDRLEDGKPNPYKNACEVVVSELLTSDTAWFLLDTRRPMKPFIFQNRKAPVFVQQTKMDSDEVFDKAIYKFGVEARGNAGYGIYFLAYGSTGEA